MLLFRRQDLFCHIAHCPIHNNMSAPFLLQSLLNSLCTFRVLFCSLADYISCCCKEKRSWKIFQKCCFNVPQKTINIWKIHLMCCQMLQYWSDAHLCSSLMADWSWGTKTILIKTWVLWVTAPRVKESIQVPERRKRFGGDRQSLFAFKVIRNHSIWTHMSRPGWNVEIHILVEILLWRKTLQPSQSKNKCTYDHLIKHF